MELYVFYFFAGLAVASAAAVVFMRHTIYCALSLIVCFAAMAALFIQMGAHFLGAIQVIVYAGAIMVLFVFVIMLLDPQSEIFRSRRRGSVLILLLPVTYFGFVVLRGLLRKAGSTETGTLADNGTIESVARSLFTDYLLPFELTSILILVAVVGAIVLAKDHN